MYDRLENPLSPSTFRAALNLLGFRYEQVADDLDVSLKTVEGWTKKSTPSQRAREYVQMWLDRVDGDITALVNEAVSEVEDGAGFVVLVTAWSGTGLKLLDERFRGYPATVHMAMVGRVFGELNARRVPCRVEYVERQGLGSRQGEPELRFVEVEDGADVVG